MRHTLKRLWHDRAPRERRIVAISATLVVIAIAYAYLWLPVAQERERLIAQVPRLRADARQMRADARDLETARAAIKTAPVDLKTALAGLTAGPRFGRMTPQISAEGNGRVRVVFASVPAEDWLAWISALSVEHGIRVETARVEALESAGLIKATATLAAGN